MKKNYASSTRMSHKNKIFSFPYNTGKTVSDCNRKRPCKYKENNSVHLTEINVTLFSLIHLALHALIFIALPPEVTDFFN